MVSVKKIKNISRGIEKEIESQDDYRFLINSFAFFPMGDLIVEKKEEDKFEVIEIITELNGKEVKIDSFLEARKLAMSMVRELNEDELEKFGKHFKEADKPFLVTDGKWVWRLGKLKQKFIKFNPTDLMV